MIEVDDVEDKREIIIPFRGLPTTFGVPRLIDASPQSISVLISAWPSPMCLCPNFDSLHGHQSHWIRPHLNDLIFTQLPLLRSASKSDHMLRSWG